MQKLVESASWRRTVFRSSPAACLSARPSCVSLPALKTDEIRHSFADFCLPTGAAAPSWV